MQMLKLPDGTEALDCRGGNLVMLHCITTCPNAVVFSWDYPISIQPHQFQFRVGSMVRLKVPGASGYRAHGHVSARETFEDANGFRRWIHVRWFDSDGKPDDQTKMHHESELASA